jgi:Single-strand binding protein family
VRLALRAHICRLVPCRALVWPVHVAGLASVFECRSVGSWPAGCEPAIEPRQATSTGNGNCQVADLAWPQEGAMSDNSVTIVGNLTDSPELRFTPNGIAVASIRLAVTPRIRERDGWKDGEPSFFRVNVWRDLAERC